MGLTYKKPSQGAFSKEFKRFVSQMIKERHILKFTSKTLKGIPIYQTLRKDHFNKRAPETTAIIDEVIECFISKTPEKF